jgi:hypothetical protein
LNGTDAGNTRLEALLLRPRKAISGRHVERVYNLNLRVIGILKSRKPFTGKGSHYVPIATATDRSEKPIKKVTINILLIPDFLSRKFFERLYLGS